MTFREYGALPNVLWSSVMVGQGGSIAGPSNRNPLSAFAVHGALSRTWPAAHRSDGRTWTSIRSAPPILMFIQPQEMDLAAAKAGVEVDSLPSVDGVIETVVGANGAPSEAPVEDLSEEEILANQPLQPGEQAKWGSTLY